MKRLLLALVILAYGISSQGMTVSLHYCCGKLVDISLKANKPATCDKHDGYRAKGCCENISISTSAVDQKAEYANIVSSQAADFLPVQPTHALSYPAVSLQAVSEFTIWPSPLVVTGRHILYRNFRL